MNKEQILQIVKNAFNECVTLGEEYIMHTPYSVIRGEEKFYQQIEQKLIEVEKQKESHFCPLGGDEGKQCVDRGYCDQSC